MGKLVDSILGLDATLAYTIVGLLVFAEDALFVGFVLPGETAAVLGGVVASRGHVILGVMLGIVILAAIIGDSVGYEVGVHLGPRLLDSKILRKRREHLDRAEDFLRRRGGSAVFLGRFVAFFRAVMPALAGTAHMRYSKFLPWNALGGATWGTVYVLLGYFAGNSYALVAKTVGRDLTAIVVLVLILAVIAWRIRKHVVKRRRQSAATARGHEGA